MNKVYSGRENFLRTGVNNFLSNTLFQIFYKHQNSYQVFDFNP